MKYATLALLGIGLAIGSSIAQGQAPAPASTPKGEAEMMKTTEQKWSYFYGLNFGKSVKQIGVKLDADLVAKGIKDAFADKSLFSDQELQEIDTAFRKILAEAEAALPEKALRAGREFLAKNKTQPGIVTLPSGVQYKVIKSGTGKSPKLEDTVYANYRGTLIDGTEFDGSAKTGGPAKFPVNGVIPGWTEVLQLMKVGDKWQVFIPTELAYGLMPRRGGKIKPNDALIFEMELVKIE